jgi:hypothetical protein
MDADHGGTMTAVLLGLFTALTGLINILALIAQSWYQKNQTKQVADDLARKNAAEARRMESKTEEVATVAKEAASVGRENASKLDSVHELVNGTGINGQLRQMAEWQFDHEAKDEQRHKDVLALLTSLKKDYGEPEHG